MRKGKCPCGRLPGLPCWQTDLQTLLSPPAGPACFPTPSGEVTAGLQPYLHSGHIPALLAQLLASHKVELPPVSEPLARLHGPSQIPKFLACSNPSEETKMPRFFHA